MLSQSYVLRNAELSDTSQRFQRETDYLKRGKIRATTERSSKRRAGEPNTKKRTVEKRRKEAETEQLEQKEAEIGIEKVRKKYKSGVARKTCWTSSDLFSDSLPERSSNGAAGTKRSKNGARRKEPVYEQLERKETEIELFWRFVALRQQVENLCCNSENRSVRRTNWNEQEKMEQLAADEKTERSSRCPAGMSYVLR